MFMIDMPARACHLVEELAHAGRAVLRLLHRQHRQVELARLDVSGHIRRQLAGQLPRIDFEQAFAALDRHAHAGPFGVDQLHLVREAHQLHVVAGAEELGRQEGTV
jgi:hypothetical protein